MSHEAAKWAATLGLRHARLAVLQNLAAHANASAGHIAFPSVATIARETGYSKRSVQAALSALRDMLVITEDGQAPSGATRYRLEVGRGIRRRPLQPAASPPPRAAACIPPTKPAASPPLQRAASPPCSRLHPEQGSEGGRDNREDEPGRRAAPAAADAPARAKRPAKPEAKPDRIPFADLPLPTSIDREAWRRWCAFRVKTGRKTWTDDAARLSIRNLQRYLADGSDPIAVIEQSIANGWRGLFPLREQRIGSAAPASKSRLTETLESLDDLERKLMGRRAPASGAAAFDYEGEVEEVR
jgi:DNA-binding transcriptional ArsR family regulator